MRESDGLIGAPCGHRPSGELCDRSEAIPEEDVRLFEHFGLTYMGVVNGHDMGELTAALENAKRALKKGSVLLHVHTRKGYGHAFADRGPPEPHGVAAGVGAESAPAPCDEPTALPE